MSYNGWTNYPTWCVALWMDNNEGSYHMFLEQAQQCLETAEGDKDAFLRAYADYLKETHEEWVELRELQGFASDLLSWALGEVNWYEIAEHKFEEVQDDGL